QTESDSEKKAAIANSKHMAKKQAKKKIESDIDESEDVESELLEDNNT
ncbi:29582_t:CDS:2, partial [Racocetra persica]